MSTENVWAAALPKIEECTRRYCEMMHSGDLSLVEAYARITEPDKFDMTVLEIAGLAALLFCMDVHATATWETPK